MTSISLLTALLAVLLGSSSTSAHGIVDQAWEGSGQCTETKTHTINVQGPLGMEFRPTVSTIVAVDALIAAVNEQGDAAITLSVRESTIDGPIVAQVSRSVSAEIGEFPASLTHFDLLDPAPVTPGNTYVIAIESTNTTHAWRGCEGPGFEYPDGEPIVLGHPGDVDFFFRTYGPGEPPTPTNTLTRPATSEQPLETPTQTHASQTATPSAAVTLPNVGQRQGKSLPLAIAGVLVGAAAMCLAVSIVLNRRSR